jgi:DNA primase
MHDTAKYLIHANITADGVVERSDVVGAIFGQTEGLLGDELDLRDLQDSSKVGRIDVEIDSRNGQSFGTVTIATSLDKVETAILGAALETIDRIGPCRSSIEVETIEDVRAAKRREIVERAKNLLGRAFDGSMMSSQEIVDEVREAIRIEDITEYEGYPAGPHVLDSDAIVVVEGRADVLQLLRYGIKNAIAVEGTNVPPEVAKLTAERTVTAFLDGDRGGELILKELAQVGDIDYVAFAPRGRSVEDLSRHEVLAALREKVAYERVDDADADPVAATDGSAVPAPGTEAAPSHAAQAVELAPEDETEEPAKAAEPEAEATAEPEEEAAVPTAPDTLRSHVRAVIEADSGEARLLDGEWALVAEGPAEEAFDLLRDAEVAPTALVLDAELPQRVLDVAAQRGVEHVVAREVGDFVKQPTSVRVRTATQLLAPGA